MKSGSARRRRKLPPEVEWDLRLYVAGQTPKSRAAITNLHKICEKYAPGKYRIEVIDLLMNPQLAHGNQIFALPTVIKKLPQPMRRVIGDLSNVERVLVGLDIKRPDELAGPKA